MAMQRITVEHADGTRRIYATNGEYEGVFVRGENDGAYRQTEGCGQTPWFRDWRHFRRYLRLPCGSRVVEHQHFDDRVTQ